jgi:hypothetical protein
MSVWKATCFISEATERTSDDLVLRSFIQAALVTLSAF